MEYVHFAIQNWYLFLGLLVVLVLLGLGPVKQLIHRVQSVGPTEAVLLINRQDGVVLDLRDAKEFHAGHIARAVNVPFGELKARVHELDKYKARPVVVSGSVGERAVKGAVILRQHGFGNVTVLAGGMGAWERSQLPVAK